MGEQKPEKVKKHICTGLLAHVDAGKTTLSEALLYTSGRIRRLGRVDRGDAYLDTYELEKKEGHHHLLQAGRAGLESYKRLAPGYAGACGFLSGNGADAAGAGLRASGYQRHRRRAGAHAHALASAGPLRNPRIYFYK